MRAIGEFIGRERARRTTDPDDGGFMTKQGWLSHADIGQAGGLVRTDEQGQRVIQFQTWTPEHGRHYRAIPDYKLAEGETG